MTTNFQNFFYIPNSINKKLSNVYKDRNYLFTRYEEAVDYFNNNGNENGLTSCIGYLIEDTIKGTNTVYDLNGFNQFTYPLVFNEGDLKNNEYPKAIIASTSITSSYVDNIPNKSTIKLSLYSVSPISKTQIILANIDV